jgi:hypothetical protein
MEIRNVTKMIVKNNKKTLILMEVVDNRGVWIICKKSIKKKLALRNKILEKQLQNKLWYKVSK